jgi:replicative DNA helicase
MGGLKAPRVFSGVTMDKLGDATWKAEFYFLASLINQPRYIFGIENPYKLFANEELQSLFRMMEQTVSSRDKNDPLLDPIRLLEIKCTPEFSRGNAKFDVGGYWEDLQDPTIQGSPEKFHRLLENYSALRIVHSTVQTKIEQLENGMLSPEEAVNKIQSDVVGLHFTESYEPMSIKSMIVDMWDNRSSAPTSSLITGYPKMDKVIGALVPGCTYLWAARTSHGKSSWVASVANKQAEAGHHVGIISLEDSRSVWSSRWLSKVSGVALGKIRDNVLNNYGDEKLTLEEEEKLEEASTKKHLNNIHVVDAKGAQLSEIIRIINDLVVRQGCEVIWLDYLQAIYADARNTRTRRDWLEYCWAMLEREAERMGVPLMMTAQLNREWEGQQLPVMPALRNTEWLGAAEQKCYVGGIIYRPYRDPRLEKGDRRARFNDFIVNIEKCKQGENVPVEFKFEPSICRITEK